MGKEQKEDTGEVFKTYKLKLDPILLMKRGWHNFARI